MASERAGRRPIELTLGTVLVGDDDVLSGEFGTEAVVLDLSDGVYYGVDGVAARIWALLRQPIALAALRDAVVAEYDVEPSRCESDLREFLSELVRRGLARIVRADGVA